MTEAPQQVTGSPERLIAYTDAVVAIAQTLLILPLLESVSDAKAHHLTTSEWFKDNGDLMIWFAMSFGLIWSLWIIHNRVFIHVEKVNGALQTVNLGWLLGIVFLPISTALLGLGKVEPLQISLYIGTLLFCSIMMNLMTWLAIRDPEARGNRFPLTANNLAASLAGTVFYLIAWALALAFPRLNYFALSIMLLMPLAIRLLRPLVKRLGWGV